MANALIRRFLNRNVFKFQDVLRTTKHNRCASIFFINDNVPCLQRPPRVVFTNQIRYYGSDKSEVEDKNKDKPSIFQRFKKMYKDYWYVLVPVHLVTSAAWFGGFYYLAKSGVDIPSLLQSLSVSEKIINPLKDSSMGYLAVSYALYKIATPARYTVTLAGTTISINYLKKWGYIKPVPSKEKLKKMYFEKKDHLMESMRETRDDLKDKKENIMEDLDKSIKQFKHLGGKVKKKEEKKDDKN